MILLSTGPFSTEQPSLPVLLALFLENLLLPKANSTNWEPRRAFWMIAFIRHYLSIIGTKELLTNEIKSTSSFVPKDLRSKQRSKQRRDGPYWAPSLLKKFIVAPLSDSALRTFPYFPMQMAMQNKGLPSTEGSLTLLLMEHL